VAKNVRKVKAYRFAIYCLFFKNEKRVKSGRKLRGNLSFWALNFNIFFQKRAKNGLKVVGLWFPAFQCTF
jgi:hypothetical protein